ncbi:hypothetical protein [Amycolatopsis thermophila]|uniref:Histone protein n=1 Tax=Amycolatopsis thermophila TaxID=206084 RepID=A0ABU0EYW9_9PSEU|nr:hypothetical protein [Amycolatopsis thermophila]MDQ0380509.1 hypothetical protein [Amycolatopsis thermophila]
MKAGARVAAAVAAGYLLGRTKKMRLALMIAAAGATGKANLSPGKLLQNGLSQLGSSPELGKLADLARDELLGAAKAAAVTAASSRIESLSDRLQEGGPLLSGKSRGKDGEQEAEPDEDTYAEEETEEESPEEEEEPQRPARRRAARGGRRRAEPEESEDTGSDEGESDEAQSDEGESDESEEAEPEEESRPTRSRRTRATATRTPVRRARR